MAMTVIGGMTEDPRAAFAAQLRQMFGNVGAFTQSQRPLIGEGYEPGASQTVHENANLRKLLEQAALLGGSNDATARYVAGQDIGFDPAANRYTAVVQAPESLGRQAQRFGLDFNPDGSLAGLRDVASGNEDFSALDKLLMAGALAAISYAAAPTMFGGAGEAAGAGAAQSAGAAPISASVPSSVASPVKVALDAIKPYASFIGPGISLLGAVQAPQAPQDLGPARVPGVEAPPEARGLDRQAARNPILDVLGRNRRANRNRTQLTGPGGVSMESVKVGRNTLLGL